MLYLTTRNQIESVTAYYTLTHPRSSDNGYFVPMRIPLISAEELSALTELSFGACVAAILNRFFPAHLNGWDIDFAIGRNPVRIASLNQKVYVSEAWHNPEGDFSRMVKNLAGRISKGVCDGVATPWLFTAVRIAVLFADFAQLRKHNVLLQGQTFDISVPCTSFEMPVACWYAREMGLPIGKIICSCLQNSLLWDFARTGNLQTASISNASAATICDSLECLIWSALGRQEASRFLACCQKGRPYSLNDLQLQRLFNGMRMSVISSHRITPIINGMYASANYLMDPYTALAYAGSQDVRATEGEGALTLLLAETSAEHFSTGSTKA